MTGNRVHVSNILQQLNSEIKTEFEVKLDFNFALKQSIFELKFHFLPSKSET